jgi:hypothetical protein
MSALGELLADPSCHLTHLDLTAHQVVVPSFRRRLPSEQQNPFRLVEHLVQGLRDNHSLVSLDLTGNDLDQDAFETLWKSLETGVVPTLEHLDLSFNGIVQLPSLPKKRTTTTTSTTGTTSRLRTLNLFGNPIFDIQPPNDTTEVLLQLLQHRHPQLGFLGEGFIKSKLYTPHIQACLDVNEAGRVLLLKWQDNDTITTTTFNTLVDRLGTKQSIV